MLTILLQIDCKTQTLWRGAIDIKAILSILKEVQEYVIKKEQILW